MVVLRSVAVGVLAVTFAPAAHATEVEVTSALVLRSQPRERASVVDRVAEGRKLELLGESRDRNWVRVKDGRRIGWAPTTMIKRRPDGNDASPTSPSGESAPEEPLARARPPRPEGWVSHSQFHDGQTAKVAVSAPRVELHARPTSDSAVMGALTRGEQVPLVRRSADGKWCLVDAGGGESAWVQADALAPGVVSAGQSNGASQPAVADAAAVTAPSEVTSTAEQGTSGEALAVSRAAPARPSGFALAAHAGLALFTRRFTSDGTGPLASYQLSTDAVTASVHTSYVRALGRRFRLGFDADYRYVGAANARYRAADGTTPSVGVSAHDASAALVAGVHGEAAGGVDLRLRVGAQMNATMVAGSPTLDLPSGELIGMNAGLAVDLPRLFFIGSHPLGVAAWGTALTIGRLFENISEGRNQSSYGGDFGARLALELWNRRDRGALLVTGGYTYSFCVTRFQGPSQRNPGGTGAVLGETQHLITGGLAYSL
jgi:uncharacterized protein YgiM (DUF1202 family)